MMKRLGEYENLIKAIGALQFTSKYMGNNIPVIFQKWKELVFEKRANRIHDMLSSYEEPSSDKNESAASREDDDGLVEAEDDYEEYFFRDHGEQEQYVKVMEENSMIKQEGES